MQRFTDEQQAVLIHLDGISLPDVIYEQHDLATLEEELIGVVEGRAPGECDGNEIGPAETTLFLYAADAAALFRVHRTNPSCKPALPERQSGHSFWRSRRTNDRDSDSEDHAIDAEHVDRKGRREGRHASWVKRRPNDYRNRRLFWGRRCEGSSALIGAVEDPDEVAIAWTPVVEFVQIPRPRVVPEVRGRFDQRRVNWGVEILEGKFAKGYRVQRALRVMETFDFD